MQISAEVIQFLKTYFVTRRGKSTLSGHLTPDETETVNLGAPTKKWGTVYAHNLVADSITGSGGSADTVDGYHAYGSPNASSLLALDGSSAYPSSTYPDAILTNGTRALTGNLSVDPTITIDGVDISAHAANSNIHHTSGMLADDHTNYVHISTGRTITAQHSFSPGSAQAPFTLGTNAQSQLVTGLRADELNKSITAGTGLSGGGALTASRTLNIDYSGGGGSTVSISSVSGTGSSNYAAKSDHTHPITTSYQPGVAAAVLASSSAGELFLSGDFGVDTDTLYVDVSEDAVYISPGTVPPTRRGALTVHPANVNQMGFVLEQLSGQVSQLFRIYDYNGNDLLLVSNAGDLESGNPGFVSHLTGWQIAHGGNAEFNDVWVRGSLHSSIFVADEMHASGGTLVVLTASRLATEVTLPAADSSVVLNIDASLDTGLSYFAASDIIRCKAIVNLDPGIDIFNLYFTVSSVGSKVGSDPGYYPTTCSLKRPRTGTSGEKLPAGTGLVKWGTVSGGAGTYTGGLLLTSDLQYSPYIDVFTVPADFSDWSNEPTATPRVRVGNLQGVLSLSDDEWGIAFGTDLSDTAQPYGIFSDQQAALVGITQTWWDNSGNAVAQIDPSAIGGESLFWLGSSSANKLIDYSASGILTLKSGVFITTEGSDSTILTGGIVWAKLDGNPYRVALYDLDPTNLIDFKTPVVGASTYSFRAKYNRGVVCASGSTNYVKDPRFSAITSGDWTSSGSGTISEETSIYYIQSKSVKILAGTTDTYLQTVTGVSVPNNSTVYAQARVYRVGSGASVRLQIRDTSTGTTRATATSSYENGWELLVASWTNTTGAAKTCQLRFDNASNDSTTIGYFDCPQLELDLPTPYFNGSVNSAHSWSGTADASTSVRTGNGYLKYDCAWSSNFTISFWYIPTLQPEEATGTTRLVQWYGDSTNSVHISADYTTDLYTVTWTGNGTTTTISPTTTLTRGTANHFCLVCDGTTLTLYINGTSVGSNTGMTAMTTTPLYLFVGVNASLMTSSILNGIIDDLIVLSDDIPVETVVLLAASSQPSTVVNGSEIHIAPTGSGRMRITADGLFFTDHLGEGVLGISTGKSSISFGGFDLTEGDLVIGHNKSGSSAILWDKDAGTFGFYGNAGATPQVIIDTDGSLVAGGGKIWLNSGGLFLDAPTSHDPSANIQWSSSGTVVGEIRGSRLGGDPGQTTIFIEQIEQATSHGYVWIQSTAPATYIGTVALRAASGASYETALDLYCDSNASVPRWIIAQGDFQIDDGYDIYGISDAWQDYSSTSTITGWTSYTTKLIYYICIGKTVFVSYQIAGTSNATTTSITLPYNNVSVAISGFTRVQDNGTAAFGWCAAATASSTLNFYKDAGTSTAWTSSGTKSVRGFIVYRK